MPSLGGWGTVGVLAVAAMCPAVVHAAPDLVVLGVDATAVTWDEINHSASGTIKARVANRGDLAASPCTVLFFEDRNGTDRFEPAADLEIGSAALAALAAGATDSVTSSINAALSFRDAPIHAAVDAAGTVAEGNESNNVGSSAPGCTFARPAGAMDAVVQWDWHVTPSDSFPAYQNVLMTPAVADLDGDRVPEVLFATTASNAGGPTIIPGMLRALHGNDGSLYFNASHSSNRINSTSSIAVGDIDLDGRPEIVAGDSIGNRLICFEHDGSFKWRSAIIDPINWGAPSLADLDADGVPEIILGRQVLNADGTLRWTGTGGRGGIAIGALSYAADVDLDGDLEVVAGNTIYNSNGTIQASDAALPDGVTALANFDADPYPEIVLVYSGQVRLLEHTLAVKWGPVALPGGGFGGSPAIADFDGDGSPEIAVSAQRFVVLETDGTVKWSAPIMDMSSNRTGCAAFDFDGDGAAEAVGRDEKSLWIFRGTDGAVLQQIPLSSCTWHEFAVIADVDADGDAEIVAGANTNCPVLGGLDHGVRVYRSANDRWLATRPLWNQFSYHVTNVNDDGSIPAIAERSWLDPSGTPYNGFRRGALRGAPALGGADFTASRLAVTCAYPNHALSARVGNAGCVVGPAGVPVSFYDGDPGSGGTLLATIQTRAPMLPGAFEDDTAFFVGAFAPLAAIHVVADDAGGLASTEIECDESNNSVSRVLSCAPVSVFPGSGETPLGLALEPSRPNPFHRATRIAFVLASEGMVRLDVHDATGRHVRTLVRGALPAGRHFAEWDRSGSGGKRMEPGIYFLRLTAGGRSVARRTVVLQ